MEYKKYNCNSYNIHTIKTDKFKTVRMEIIFSREAEKDKMPYFTFLADILSDSSKKHKSRKDIAIELEELYKASFYGLTNKIGNLFTITFVMEFIDPFYIKDKNYLNSVIKFPFEIINNPRVKNNEFDLTNFNIVKKRLREEIESIKESSSKMAISEALTAMDKESPSSYKVLGNIETLENISPSNLYEAYLNLFNHSNCDIFVIGNINMDECVKIIKDNFKNKIIKLNKPKIYISNKTRKRVLEKSKVSSFIQSDLVMIYNIGKQDEFTKNITFHVFNYILGGGLTSILYKNLRNDNSLCYSLRSLYLKQDGLLLINVLLDKSNISKAKKLINKSIEEIRTGKFSSEVLADSLKILKTSLKNGLDNNETILSNYEFNMFDNLPLLEERIPMLDKVTKKNIMKCANNLKLNTTYALVGDNK